VLPCAVPREEKTGWPNLTLRQAAGPGSPSARALQHMSTTKVYTINRKYTLEELPKVGAPIKQCTAYPMMHDDHGNEYFAVLHSMHVDDGILQVIGDGDNGWYEWVWFTGCGTIHHTRSGWGMASRCLQDGLNFAFNLQTVHQPLKPHQLA